MNDFFASLLNLGGMAPGESFTFARPLPPWAWASVVVAALVLAGWSYWRLAGSRTPRMFLAFLRAAVLTLLVILLCGPQYVRQNERVERDWVAVLVDRSGSMQTPDAAAPGSPRETRAAFAQQAVRNADPAWAAIAERSNLLWLGFDSSVFDLPVAAGNRSPELDQDKAAGAATNLSAALEQTLRRLAARPVSGVVVISDGRSVSPPSRALIKRLQGEQIPVFSVPVGRDVAPPDFSIGRIESPKSVFVNDIVPVSAEINLSSPDALEPREAQVELVDAQGNVVDRQRARLAPAADGQASARVTLTSTPSDAGVRNWTLRLVPEGEDLAPENNQSPVRFEAVDRQIRVLYLDGYPRWEYRYLKNLFLRERSIRASATLLAADRRFIQEGTEPLASIPSSREEWARYDVIVIGDVRSELFSAEQLANLREHVASRGAGLLWIAGANATPGTWGSSPLGDLLPMQTSSEQRTPLSVFKSPVTVQRAPAAERLGLLNLGETPRDGWPASLADPARGWTKLWWAQNIDPGSLKPTAEPIAFAVPEPSEETSSAADAIGRPLVITMRFGAGRVVYVGTDETWRWRYARGEPLPERFWLPIVRLLARESLSRADTPAILEVAPQRASTGRPVRLAVRILDQRLLENQPTSIAATITQTDQRDASPLSISLTPELGQGGVFSSTWVPGAPGTYRVDAADSSLGGTTLSAVVDVFAPDDERRSPQTDHPTLAALAQQTGGQLITPENLSSLPQLLPNRQLRISDAPEVRTLWDSPAALAALVLLLVLEWVGRRLIRLV